MFPHYREMKNKFKVTMDDRFYFNYIQDVTSQMFKWDEKIYIPQIFDRMLRDCGMAALIKTDTSDYTPVFFCPVGQDRYADGWFKDCKCYDFRANEYDFNDWLNNPDILVFFNTQLRNPDIFADRYAEMLTDVDVSIKNNVHYSRMHPVPVARDKKTANRIDAVIKSMNDSNFDTIVMDTNIKDVLGDKDGVDMLNLTDVDKQQYIQYLSHLHDSIVSRLFFFMGLGTTDNGKQAQITTEELNKNDDASITMALAWYSARKEAIEQARKKGHELEFDFSDVWKVRVERIINPPEQQEQQEDGDSNLEKEVSEDAGDDSNSENSSDE